MRKQTRVGIAVIAACGIIISGGTYLRQKFVLPILMYHSVAAGVAPGDRLTVSEKAFDRQMAFLRKSGYTVLSLDQALEMITKRKKPARTIAVTFDDGYENNFTSAFPILKKYRIPATVFLICSRIGTPGYLTWDQIRQMRESGLVTFGSHTVTHRSLNEVVSPAERDAEISGSRALLEERLGERVTLFSYPLGHFNPSVRDEVARAGYAAAVATNPGRAVRDDDLFALKRLRISENAGNLFVFWIETSGYYNLMREKRHK